MPPLRADPASPSAAPPVRRPTVLIVDADVALRDAFEMVLRPSGCRLFKAEGGQAALDLLRRHRVDVVILDGDLDGRGDGDGAGPWSSEALLHHLRARFPDVEVVLTGASPALPVVVRAIKAGAFDYVAKDF